MQQHINREFLDKFNEALLFVIEESQNATMSFLVKIFVEQIESQGYSFSSLLFGLSEIAHSKGENWSEVVRHLEEAWSAAQRIEIEEDRQ